MKIRITEAQFIEAVYRNYHGETITEIAEDFGVSQPTLSQLKSRRSKDWKRIQQQIATAEIVKLVFENKNNLPTQIFNPPNNKSL